MKYLFLLLILLLNIDKTKAQQLDSIPCPSIKISGPRNGEIGDGQTLDLSVASFKKDYEKSHTLSYLWMVNNGNIIGDNKKRKVLVNTKGLINQDIYATVIVLGLEENCPNTSSITINVVALKFRTETKIIKGKIQ